MRIEFDQADNIVFAIVTAPAGPDELMDHMWRLLRHPEFDTSMTIIMDARKLGLLDWTTGQIRHMSYLISRVGPLECARRMAVIEDTDAGFGMLRMWQVYTDDAAGGERMVFRQMHEAREWARQQELSRDAALQAGPAMYEPY